MSVGNTIHTELLKLLEKQLNVIWQLGSLDDKLEKWINSIFVDSIILTNKAPKITESLRKVPLADPEWGC